MYASGKLAGACYKLELEAAFRSAELSGFQLLDIKDFTGQGTALVGILNAFHKNKGIIPRSEWRMFCSDAVLLPTLDSFARTSLVPLMLPISKILPIPMLSIVRISFACLQD